MLFNMLQGYSGLQLMIMFFARLFIVFCILPLHEYAHAFVATKLGDQTARLSGRLTISPFAHLDPIGAIMIFLVGFGYAKPVPVNPRNFKDPKKGMALTAIAGPLANILLSIIFLIFLHVSALFGNGIMASAFVSFFYFAASINIGLAIFNLIPIPPLDGSRILQLLIPNKYYFKFAQYERYIVLVVFGLIIFGVLDKPLAYLEGAIFSGLDFIVSIPFNLFS